MRVVILGAGASGICLGVKLREAGVRDFVILEKSDDVGGTWHDNSYPGACCDVPSHFYSFSFERKADWSRKFAPQAEIQAYFRHVVEKYGLRPHLRLGTEAASARFDEAAGVWHVVTTAGETFEAEVLASGLGQLNRPHVPDFPGRDSFRGPSFHSARWDHGVDLAGKRVAVIGNAASALQFIPPVAARAAHVDVFQRTPNWVMPRLDHAYSERAKWAFAHVPGLERLYRWWIYWNFELRFTTFRGRGDGWLARRIRELCEANLAAEIPDPALRKKLTPDYAPGCKRLLISDDYLQALRRDDVSLVTSGIERIAPEGVVTRDGETHPADVLVYGTGFETTSFLAPLEIEGLGGRKLHEQWKGGAEAYLGVAVSGFPNLFLLYGPNTNLGHNSILFMIEAQVRYIVECIAELSRSGRAFIEVRAEAQEAFNDEVQAALADTVWASSCGSWYKTAAGKITNNWKGFTLEYWWRMRRPDWSAFTLRGRREDRFA
jgi:cation diffusion facilitator CzcD-associated flavoprotein CzcO